MSFSIWHYDIHPIEMYPREMREEDVKFQRALLAAHPEKYAPRPTAKPPEGELDKLMSLKIVKGRDMERITAQVEEALGYTPGSYSSAGYGTTLRAAVAYACAQAGHPQKKIADHLSLASRNSVAAANRCVRDAYKARIDALRVQPEGE